MIPYSRTLILGILVSFVIFIFAVMIPGPLVYTLEKDTFPSRFHDNTDVQKIRSVNSSTDIFPLMQELIDFSGPLVLNIHIRDFDEARRLLETFAKNDIRVSNLVISLDMSESDMEDFAKSNDRQMQVLRELLNQTISLDDLQSLEIKYRDENRPDLLLSVQYQGDAVRKKIRELYERYRTETEHIIKVSKKFDLDTREEEQSLAVVTQMVKEIDNTVQEPEIPLRSTPSLTLIMKPEEGAYRDTIELFGAYTGPAGTARHPVTVFLDDTSISGISSDDDGTYRTSYEIGRIPAGLHPVYAASGLIRSGYRMLNVTPVRSKISLEPEAVYNRPEVICRGSVIANRPVKNAPVELLSDFTTILQATGDGNGNYQARMRFSPGTHRLEARFVNDSYPIFSSKSPVYEIIATRDSITSIRMIDAAMDADELTVTIDPVTAFYKDTITISGILSGTNPKNKVIEVFLDAAYRMAVRTGPDGSYSAFYPIERIRPGPHTVFTHYQEPAKGELYSESRIFNVSPVGSRTTLLVEVTDGGTALICRGNVTADTRALSSAPAELVWDDRNVIDIQTDATGSFRQKVSLPVGKHRIFARFSSRDYPVNPSASAAVDVELLPPIDLYVTPDTVRYMDTLTIGGSLHGVNTSSGRVRVLIDGKTAMVASPDNKGKYTTTFTIERTPGGTHSVQASSGDFMSEIRKFQVQPVNSELSLNARKIPDTSRVICSGQLTAGTKNVQNAPVLIIWDDRNFIETLTDGGGNFEETIPLPAGTHRIGAQFNRTDIYPIHPSESPLITIEIPYIRIPGNVTLAISPDRGVFGDILVFSGQLQGRQIFNEDVVVYIDNKTLGRFRTNQSGMFGTRYGIERIPAGMHTAYAVSGDFRSDHRNFEVLPVDSGISLAASKTGGTSQVVCSGMVTAGNKPVRFAPVRIISDTGAVIRTETGESGSFEEVITLSSGKHRIRAQFNSTELFPLFPSESAPVDIEISPSLSLHVTPASGIYQDTITFDGVLVRPYQTGGHVDIFLDNKNITALDTDRQGRYRYQLVIERLAGGPHVVQARSGEISSDRAGFQVQFVRSRTSLTVEKINTSALFACKGTVMAFDRPGSIIRIPFTVQDVYDILATFGKNPLGSAKRGVTLAPVELILDNRTMAETQTDSAGTFSAVVSLPEGEHRVFARFINSSFPVLSSRSDVVDADIAFVNVTLQTGEEAPQVRVFSIAVVAISILIFTGGAMFYAKKRSGLFRRKIPGGKTTAASPPAPSREPAPAFDYVTASPSSPDAPMDQGLLPSESYFTRYVRILKGQGLSLAARTVYLHFSGFIALKLHIARHRTLTPREFLRLCEQRPFAAAFSSFVSVYERIRYGGARTSAEQEKIEDAMKKTDASLEGDDH